MAEGMCCTACALCCCPGPADCSPRAGGAAASQAKELIGYAVMGLGDSETFIAGDLLLVWGHH